MGKKVQKTEQQWREQLTPEQYRVTREQGTEPPFSGEYHATTAPGSYVCICCGETLFQSETKFDAGCGWPSFYQPVEAGRIDNHDDFSYGRHRVEVRCSNCDAHLGHVFEDGPAPTGLRYCINSVAIQHQQPEDNSKASET